MTTEAITKRAKARGTYVMSLDHYRVSQIIFCLCGCCGGAVACIGCGQTGWFYFVVSFQNKASVVKNFFSFFVLQIYKDTQLKRVRGDILSTQISPQGAYFATTYF